MKLSEAVAASVCVTATITAFAFAARAQMQSPPVDIPCPSEEPCQVLVLTKTEISILTADTGILATAAQARNLDLGQYVSYFRQKIALAPAGKNPPKPANEAPAPPASGNNAGAPAEKKLEPAKK